MVEYPCPSIALFQIYGVYCNILHHTVPVEEQCLTGDVHLVNSSKMAGRLEVCFNGVWGTVCRYGWTAQATTVVCKQLGFNFDNAGVVSSVTHIHFYIR